MNSEYIRLNDASLVFKKNKQDNQICVFNKLYQMLLYLFECYDHVRLWFHYTLLWWLQWKADTYEELLVEINPYIPFWLPYHNLVLSHVDHQFLLEVSFEWAIFTKACWPSSCVNRWPNQFIRCYERCHHFYLSFSIVSLPWELSSSLALCPSLFWSFISLILFLFYLWQKWSILERWGRSILVLVCRQYQYYYYQEQKLFKFH